MLNTRLKTAANNEFGKDVFKLVINSVFRSPSKILGKKEMKLVTSQREICQVRDKAKL